MRSAHATLLLGVFGVLVQSCAGCSEECRDTTQGAAEGCPCQSDQDCATRLGEVLMCQEGACSPADPPDAAADSCNADSDCGDGELCGLGTCSPAPQCQRIDVGSMNQRRLTTDGVLQGGGEVTVSRDGCSHTIEGDFLEARDLTVTDISPKNGAADVSGDCSTGRWFAGMRAGVFQCGSEIVVVSVQEVCSVSADFCETGTCASIGSDLDEDLGVCQ